MIPLAADPPSNSQALSIIVGIMSRVGSHHKFLYSHPLSLLYTFVFTVEFRCMENSTVALIISIIYMCIRKNTSVTERFLFVIIWNNQKKWIWIKKITPLSKERIERKKIEISWFLRKFRFVIASVRGFEPPTFWSVAKRSIQLS